MKTPQPDSTETRRLLAQARPGDRQSFDRLFEQHRAYLGEIIDMRLDPALRTRLDASDVVQEAQIDAFARFEEYLARKPMPFRLWLRKTAYERLLKMRARHIEAGRRAVRCEIPLPDRSSLQLAQRLTAGGSTPSRQAHSRDLARQVRRVLSQLSEADREILLMRTLEGLSYREVAQVLGIDEGTGRKRHARALRRLHAALVSNGLRESQL